MPQLEYELVHNGFLHSKRAKLSPETKYGKKAKREVMTVTTSTDKEFDADPVARLNIMSAILAATFLNQTSTTWRLADGNDYTVTLDELNEANALALQKFGEITGVV